MKGIIRLCERRTKQNKITNASERLDSLKKLIDKESTALQQHFLRLEIDNIVKIEERVYPGAERTFFDVKQILENLSYEKVFSYYPKFLDLMISKEELATLSQSDLSALDEMKKFNDDEEPQETPVTKRRRLDTLETKFSIVNTRLTKTSEEVKEINEQFTTMLNQ